MKIAIIFADRLFSFCHHPDDDERDEFERLFETWQDPEYLEEFFETHKRDLQSGFITPIPTVEQAVLMTRAEAKRLEKHLLHLAQAPSQNLDAVFKPLSEQEDVMPFPRFKAYGLQYNSWLRVYALKIGHRYYITGGAIKLTGTMQEREHTNLELKKLGRCSDFFKELGIYDIEGARELDIDIA